MLFICWRHYSLTSFTQIQFNMVFFRIKGFSDKVYTLLDVREITLIWSCDFINFVCLCRRSWSCWKTWTRWFPRPERRKGRGWKFHSWRAGYEISFLLLNRNHPLIKLNLVEVYSSWDRDSGGPGWNPGLVRHDQTYTNTFRYTTFCWNSLVKMSNFYKLDFRTKW